MNISYAAIAMAYYLVNQELFPQTLVFYVASKKLEEDGHFVLLASCEKLTEQIDWTNPEPTVEQLPPAILRRYRVADRDYTGKMRYLKSKADGRFIKTDEVISGWIITGGQAPTHGPSSGRVEVNGGTLYYPSVLKLEWV